LTFLGGISSLSSTLAFISFDRSRIKQTQPFGVGYETGDPKGAGMKLPGSFIPSWRLLDHSKIKN
jgi:hypothetical protein